MRETLFFCFVQASLIRITPAYAGNTRVVLPYTKNKQDHPRVCGKHYESHVTKQKFLGSPPRMRETLKFISIRSKAARITPAYAGNTTCADTFNGSFQDHPRVCGKHCTLDAKFAGKLGSPPRMRETPDGDKFALFFCRITPAYAGNTIYFVLM